MFTAELTTCLYMVQMQ